MPIDTKNISDWELVRLFEKTSHDGAFTEILNRYKNKIYTAIFYIIKDHYIAEDLFQETFIKVAQNIQKGKYQDQGKLGPWISRIAHNLCIDYIRKQKSSHHLKVIKSETFDIERLAVSYDPKDNLEVQQTNDTLWKMLNRLPQEQLEVVVMRIYGDMSFKEISECMNVSINTSLGRMRYGLMNLRKMIQEEQLVLR